MKASPRATQYARRRAAKSSQRGAAPVTTLPAHRPAWLYLVLWLWAWGAIVAFALFFLSAIGRAFTIENVMAIFRAPKGAFALFAYVGFSLWALPGIVWGLSMLARRRFHPLGAGFQRLTWTYIFALAYLIAAVLIGGHGRRAALAHVGLHGVPLALFELAIAGGLMIGARPLLAHAQKTASRLSAGTPPDGQFGLWLGEATGTFAEHGHQAAIAHGSQVTLGFEDAAQNICAFGGIGSGKTTRAVKPLLLQLLHQDCGGLIFDVKGDFGSDVIALADETHRPLVQIGPEFEPLALLAGLTPETAGSFLKSAFLVGGAPRDPFWVDTAAELCRNSLGVLNFLDGRYNLNALYRFIFDADVREQWTKEAREQLAVLEGEGRSRDARLLESYLNYHDGVFASFEDRVKSNVLAQAAQVLSPFTHPDLVDAFCGAEGRSMQELLDGAVFLVRLPLAIHGVGAKVAYTFIKLRFFNLLQRRQTETRSADRKPVFFCCDEFQEIVSYARDGLSDLNFWDKSRSSGCIGVISAQGVSSFYAAVGNRDLAHAILQNFRQKLCFRTEDQPTIDYLVTVLGQIDRVKMSVSQSSSHQPFSLQNPLSFLQRTQQSGHSLSLHREAVVNPQLFRTLDPDMAVAMLSIGGQAFDDVLVTDKIYH